MAFSSLTHDVTLLYSAILIFNILELIPNSITLLIESKADEKSINAQYNKIVFLI